MTLGFNSLAGVVAVLALASSTGCAGARPESPPRAPVMDATSRSCDEAAADDGWTRDANVAQGPDSTVVMVRTDEHMRPRLWIAQDPLDPPEPLIGDVASLPRWSPDGAYLACVLWKSARRFGDLGVVDVAGRRLIIEANLAASTSRTEWSPDSRLVAATGAAYGRPATMLNIVAVPDGRVAFSDTAAVLADYDLAWSPGGQLLAFVRHTAIDPATEEPVASEIWIFDADEPKVRRVVADNHAGLSDPRWVSDSTFTYCRHHWDGARFGSPEARQCEVAAPDADGRGH